MTKQYTNTHDPGEFGDGATVEQGVTDETMDAPLHAALQRWRDEDHEETIVLSREQVIDLCEEFRALTAALPHMGGVSEEMLIAAFLRGESWRKRNDIDRYVAVPGMVEKAARDYADAILSALASHEPAPEPAKDRPEVVDRLRKWRSETINQWSDEYEPRENWERQVSGAMREWDKATTEIISNYEALRATLDDIGTKVAEIQTKERPHPVKITSRETQLSPIHIVVFSDGSIYDFELGWRSH